MNNSVFIERLHKVCQGGICAGDDIPAGYLRDWLGQYHGRALVLARPSCTAEVAAIVRLCHEAKISMVPQGGNTGYRGGATPDDSGTAVLLAMERMRAIRAINPAAGTITVEAGCILEDVQRAAEENGMFFPLHLGAAGSCQIGGNLATNAGGVNVLRYGNARDLCLGVEAVLPSGEIMNLLTGLRKDNTGYDVKNLLIGSEGTLGVITAAVMRLFPALASRVAVFAAVPNVRAALELLLLCQQQTDGMMESFELIPEILLSLLHKHMPHIQQPFASPQLTVLAEAAGGVDIGDRLLAAMEVGLERGLLTDAVAAQSESQRRQFWQLRESTPEATKREGGWSKMDVTLPLDKLADFIDTAEDLIAADVAGQYIIAFGHLGDGNLHLSLRPNGESPAANPRRAADLEAKLLDAVKSFGGSFSAEHGIGQSKLAEMRCYKDPVALDVMRAVKRALDPHGIMNPGKMIVW